MVCPVSYSEGTPGCEVNLLPPSSAEINNERRYAFAPFVFLHGMDREHFTLIDKL
jgi:hypothetical protein